MGKISQRLWSPWRVLLAGLIVTALTISAVLSWHYITGGAMVGCGSGSSCSNVLGSRWSALAGVFPVSGMALGVYSAMLVVVFFIGTDTENSVRRLAWSAILVLSGSVVGSAVWFTVIQKRFIGEFCPYCTTAHVTGIFISTLVIWRVFHEFESISGKIKSKVIVRNLQKRILGNLQIVTFVFSGLVLAVIMAVVQVNFMPLSVNQDGVLYENYTIIDYQDAPVIGSPDAPYTVILLFDYNCPHCQKIHFMLEDAVRHYEGKLAFLLCPIPLNRECNQYVLDDVEAFRNSCDLAKISLSVWFANKEAFAEFDNWMFSFESGNTWLPRNTEAARAKAIELFGYDVFYNTLASPQVEQYLQKSIRIYGQTIQGGRGGIPKMIYGSRWITPEPYNAEELVSMIQKNLFVPLP
ncbi:MAG: vitamin K epoxide reductase family protein [Bacteroidales bacterium]|jgi:uncharacterized membrane protein|nr:vitamin K epoxide reductase family protein [Bacteroidales bacterium]